MSTAINKTLRPTRDIVTTGSFCILGQAAQPSLGTTMYQTVKKQCRQGQYIFTNHLPWIQDIVRVRTPWIQNIELNLVFSSHQVSNGSGGQLIAPRWLHILQQCCTISQLIYRAVVVDTTIVHVRQIANTGLVTLI